MFAGPKALRCRLVARPYPVAGWDSARVQHLATSNFQSYFEPPRKVNKKGCYQTLSRSYPPLERHCLCVQAERTFSASRRFVPRGAPHGPPVLPPDVRRATPAGAPSVWRPPVASGSRARRPFEARAGVRFPRASPQRSPCPCLSSSGLVSSSLVSPLRCRFSRGSSLGSLPSRPPSSSVVVVVGGSDERDLLRWVRH